MLILDVKIFYQQAGPQIYFYSSQGYLGAKFFAEIRGNTLGQPCLKAWLLNRKITDESQQQQCYDDVSNYFQEPSKHILSTQQDKVFACHKLCLNNQLLAMR